MLTLSCHAQVSIPAEAAFDLSKTYSTGMGIRAGVLARVNDNLQLGIKTGFTHFIDRQAPYIPLMAAGKYMFHSKTAVRPFFAVEGGKGFYNDKENNMKGGVHFYGGFGFMLAQEHQLPLYAHAGVSAFEFSGPGTHYINKRLSFRVGVDF